MHYYDENRRVDELCGTSAMDDTEGVLRAINGSGESSFTMLQNGYPPNPAERTLSLVYCISKQMPGNKGAQRIHGSGFAGRLLAVVPNGILGEYMCRMNSTFERNCCLPVSVRKCAFELTE